MRLGVRALAEHNGLGFKLIPQGTCEAARNCKTKTLPHKFGFNREVLHHCGLAVAQAPLMNIGTLPPVDPY